MCICIILSNLRTHCWMAVIIAVVGMMCISWIIQESSVASGPRARPGVIVCVSVCVPLCVCIYLCGCQDDKLKFNMNMCGSPWAGSKYTQRTPSKHPCPHPHQHTHTHIRTEWMDGQCIEASNKLIGPTAFRWLFICMAQYGVSHTGRQTDWRGSLIAWQANRVSVAAPKLPVYPWPGSVVNVELLNR